MDGGQLLNKQKTLFVETTKREEGLKQDPLVKQVEKKEDGTITGEATDQIRNLVKQNTDIVPPEKIAVAAEEKVEDIVFDRKTDSVFLPVNGQEILMQPPVRFGDVARKNTPEMQLKFAMSDVTTDTKWYGDSEQMRVIKEDVMKLRDMGSDTSPLDMVMHYDRMIAGMNRYLSEKDKASSRYAPRHKKVRTLLDQVTAARARLLGENENLRQDAFAKRSKEAYEKRLSDTGITSVVRELKTHYLDKGIPATENELEDSKKNILALYDRQINYYKGIAEGFCIREAAKQKRMDAARMIEQLLEEKELIASVTVNSTRSDQVHKTWGDLFLPQSEDYVETYDVSNEFMKEHKPIRQANDAYSMFTNLVGGENLFILGKDKVKLSYTDDEGKQVVVEDYMREEKQGMTLPEALDKANKMDLPLMYSDEVVQQLQTIQLIDFVMGQKNRNDNSFEVKCSIESVENKDYLVIKDIKVRDHVDSLGTESVEELNRENKGQSTRVVFDPESEKMHFSDYDPKVADKIIDLDENVVERYLKNLGIPEANAGEAKKRLTVLKRALYRDKKMGQRNTFETYYESCRASGAKGLAKYREQKRKINRMIVQYTYISSAMMQDAGETDLLETEEINRRVDEESTVVKGILQKKQSIRDHIKEDLGDEDKKSTLSPEVRKAVEVVKGYADVTDRSVQSVVGMVTGTAGMLKKYDPDRYDAMLNEALKEHGWKKYDPDEVIDLSDLFETKDREKAEIERREEKLKEELEWDDKLKILNKEIEKKINDQDGNKTQYWVHEVAKRRKKAIDTLEQTITALKQKDPKTARDETEISRLQFYLDNIGVTITGNLDYKKSDEKRVRDREFERGLKFVDERDTPLFLEEPSVRDICQGGTGDCYFIAALASVVEKDNSFIKNHMKDNGDGTVTVKLYKPGKLYGYNPVFVTVDKTSVFKGSGNRGAVGCLWVQMYEKAYVASGIRANFFGKIKYDSISGGLSEEALGYITGQKAEKVFDNTYYGSHYNASLSSKMKEKDNKTGKTTYTPEFEEVVNEIIKKLKFHIGRGDVLAASAYKKLVGSTGKGSSGESIRRGVAGRHAYTVTDMEIIDGKYYVHVRNPWGQSAVETVKNGLTGKNMIRESHDSTRSVTFLMEIHDFVESMRYVTALDSKKFYQAGKKAQPKL